MTCNNCEYLSLTEEEQNAIRRENGEIPPHICKMYGERVFHFPYFEPDIHPCEECIAEKRESENINENRS